MPLFATRATLPRSYLAGFGTARNGGTPNTKIDIAVGACRDDTDAFDIKAAATLTIDFGTTGANGLDTGALANATWYHNFAIAKGDGTVAGFGSTSLTPTLPSGYSYKRRLGSVKTNGSAQFLAYSQTGDRFTWDTPTLDITAATPGGSAVTRALSVPTGVVVEACFNFELSGVTNDAIEFSALAVADLAPSTTAAPLSQFVAVGAAVTFSSFYRCLTNTLAQIRSRMLSGAGGTLYMSTTDWIDRRGRDD